MQIDPKLMNEQLGGGGKVNKRYQRKDSIQPIAEVDESQEMELTFQEDDLDDIGYYEDDFEDEAPQKSNGPKHARDEEVLPGLYQSQIDSWKKQFGDVFYAEVKGQAFIFRALERYEYKQIISTPNTDPLMREEMMCEYCVLYPSGYDFSTMANQKAGYPAVLSELIMDHSGFTRDVKVAKL